MFIQPFQKSIKGESFHKLGKFLEKDAKSSGPKCVATCEKIYEGVSWDKGEKNIKEFFAVIEKQINQGMENLGKIWSFPN